MSATDDPAGNTVSTHENVVEVAIVIPVLNEEDILWDNLTTLGEFLDQTMGRNSWMFILVDNNSVDSTPEIIRRALVQWPPSVGVHETVQNYGRAVKSGVNVCSAPWLMILDVERWDLPFIRWCWRNRDSYDVFLGSKRADPTICEESFYRRVLSWGLNSLIQLLFQYPGHETHGPKLVRMETIVGFLPACVSERGQYDTEIVLRALKGGARVVELPIVHADNRPPKNLMVKKVVFNVIGLYKLWRRLRVLDSVSPISYRRFSRSDVTGAGPNS